MNVILSAAKDDICGASAIINMTGDDRKNNLYSQKELIPKNQREAKGFEYT